MNLASSGNQREGGFFPPPFKRARLSVDTAAGEPSMASSSHLSSSGLHTNHKLEGMQSDSKTESNGECHTNGYNETNGGSESWRDNFSEKRKRQVQSMTTMETDMICLIGQHLRESGYQ